MSRRWCRIAFSTLQPEMGLLILPDQAEAVPSDMAAVIRDAMAAAAAGSSPHDKLPPRPGQWEIDLHFAPENDGAVRLLPGLALSAMDGFGEEAQMLALSQRLWQEGGFSARAAAIAGLPEGAEKQEARAELTRASAHFRIGTGCVGWKGVWLIHRRASPGPEAASGEPSG